MTPLEGELRLVKPYRIKVDILSMTDNKGSTVELDKSGNILAARVVMFISFQFVQSLALYQFILVLVTASQHQLLIRQKTAK